MSEYQYYEFLSIDRPLTKQEMRELRAVSTRAAISSTRFVNEYDWGDLKADPARWMERYFDAFLYFSNWGTHRVMLRLPSRLLPLQTAQQYCSHDPAEARGAGGFIILDFTSDEEPGDEWYDEGGGVLASLLPVRADLAAGDHRALHLGWLLRVQAGDVAESEAEPPVPTGLARLTAGLQAFTDFLRIDPDLIAAAAERSPKLEEAAPREELEHWIATLPDAEKSHLLVRVAAGEEGLIRAELQRRFRETRRGSQPDATEPRTAAELLDGAERKAEVRRHREAERAAKERARREREEAEALDRRLDELVKREEEAWRRVDELIAERKSASYDEAVKLLGDLRTLGAREGRAAEAEDRIRSLRRAHARKGNFLVRLERAGLG
jgi:hypothetical protein